ncbi:hypothetical protein E2C01_040536 [Portunus trituberculatus]|uniref:Uncharacterized protein n=1 Tax=Portunus trituberculatus TaxID=210409 RepID=A0A5B7FNI7_PORTR|nr:hypothetical protein [Portunus trituberculatus]
MDITSFFIPIRSCHEDHLDSVVRSDSSEMISYSLSVLTPQSGANLHCEWIIFLHFHLVSYTMACKHPSRESNSKKSRKTVTNEKKLEVLNCYATEDLGDCPSDGTEAEHTAYHQSKQNENECFYCFHDPAMY